MTEEVVSATKNGVYIHVVLMLFIEVQSLKSNI